MLNLDLILFIIFLSCNLILGLRAGRKVKTLKHYAIGDKKFSTGTLTSTIVATWIGGELLFSDLQYTYTMGLKYIIAALCACICLLVIGQFLAHRMKEFLKNISVAEAMGDLYGKKIRVITAISGILLGIGFLAMQLQVTNRMLNLIFGLNNKWGVVLASFIIIIYSAFGGIRSVTITDVFQFITFFIFLPLFTFIIWSHIKNPQQIVNVITNSPLFSFKNIIQWDFEFFSFLALSLYYIIPGIHPSHFQRIAMAKNIQQVKYSFNYAGIISALIVIILAFLAILLMSDNPNLNPEQLIHHIINAYAYPGFKGLIAVGIISMAMSTADSHLNASAIIGINDILQPLKSKYKPSITHVRIFAVFLGILALILALRTRDLLELLLLSASFYVPVVTVSLLLAILGFRSSKKSVLIGMGAGISTVFIWKVFLSHTGIDSVIPGFLSNLIFFMGSHYLLRQKGGWVGIKENAPLIAAKIERKRFWQSLLKNIKNPQPYVYFKKNLPSREIFYSLFGIYMLGATYGSFFIIPEDIKLQYNALYDHIYHIVIITSAVFITYPAWPNTFKRKKFIAFAWPTALLYVLFIIGSILLMMSGFHEVQMFIFLLNIVLVALLLEWPLWIGMLIVGWFLAKSIFLLYTGDIPQFSIPIKDQFRFLYGLPLFSIFIIALIRFKQAKKGVESENLALMLKNQHMSKNLLESYQGSYKFLKKFQESGANKLYEIALLNKNILSQLKETKIDNKIIADVERLEQKITPLAYHLDQLDNRAIRYLKLDISSIAIDDLIKKIEKKLKMHHLEKHIHWQIMTTQKNIVCDVKKIIELFINVITFIKNSSDEASLLLIGLKDTQINYPLDTVHKKYQKKAAAVGFIFTNQQKLPELKSAYKPNQQQLIEIVQTDNLPLMNNSRIVQAHYGYEYLEVKQDNLLTQLYILPYDITALRPKELDFVDPIKVNQNVLKNYPGLQMQEETFLGKIKKMPHVNIKKVQEAITLMKKYHGDTKRNSGEPFFMHPLEVANIVATYKTEEDTIIAALLHDTVEDTPLSLEQIAVLFNRNVARLVEGVTHLSCDKEPELYHVKLSPQENIQKLLTIGDSHILCIKLADRLHNMRTIKTMSLRSQKKKAEETLLFFVPIARHLGFDIMAKQLNKLAFDIFNNK